MLSKLRADNKIFFLWNYIYLFLFSAYANDSENEQRKFLKLNKEKAKFIKYLLEEDKKTLDQIADIVGVSVDFVKSVKIQFTNK